jgi:hypothetical protein
VFFLFILSKDLFWIRIARACYRLQLFLLSVLNLLLHIFRVTQRPHSSRYLAVSSAAGKQIDNQGIKIRFSLQFGFWPGFHFWCWDSDRVHWYMPLEHDGDSLISWHAHQQILANIASTHLPPQGVVYHCNFILLNLDGLKSLLCSRSRSIPTRKTKLKTKDWQWWSIVPTTKYILN